MITFGTRHFERKRRLPRKIGAEENIGKFSVLWNRKGPVKLMQRGENTSFMFTVCQICSCFHFKLTYVVLYRPVFDVVIHSNKITGP